MDIHSTSPRRLSDMSELSNESGSTTEAAYSSGVNDSEVEYEHDVEENDDRKYESNSDDSSL
jgi:hypothetical protein